MKRTVFFVGNLCADAEDGQLGNFVTSRAKELDVDVTIFNTKVFPKGTHPSGRITVNADAASAVSVRSFSPRGVYIRPWKFPDEDSPRAASASSNAASESANAREQSDHVNSSVVLRTPDLTGRVRAPLSFKFKKIFHYPFYGEQRLQYIYFGTY